MVFFYGLEDLLKATQTTARWMLAVFALLLVGYAILYQCFSERLIYFDEVGLFNPVYTYLHYGKASRQNKLPVYILSSIV